VCDCRIQPKPQHAMCPCFWPVSLRREIVPLDADGKSVPCLFSCRLFGENVECVGNQKTVTAPFDFFFVWEEIFVVQMQPSHPKNGGRLFSTLLLSGLLVGLLLSGLSGLCSKNESFFGFNQKTAKIGRATSFNVVVFKVTWRWWWWWWGGERGRCCVE